MRHDVHKRCQSISCLFQSFFFFHRNTAIGNLSMVLITYSLKLSLTCHGSFSNYLVPNSYFSCLFPFFISHHLFFPVFFSFFLLFLTCHLCCPVVFYPCPCFALSFSYSTFQISNLFIPSLLSQSLIPLLILSRVLQPCLSCPCPLHGK